MRDIEPKHGQPFVVQIIRLDNWAQVAVMLFLISWGSLIYDMVATSSRSTQPSVFLYVAPIATLISMPLLVWRILLFQRIFATGIKVRGLIIASYPFWQGQLRLEYIYMYQGREYNRIAGVPDRDSARVLHPGRVVDVIVDPHNPKTAFIEVLYRSSAGS